LFDFGVITQFTLGVILLIAGAWALVHGGSRLAEAFGIPPVVIGLTIIAWGTSAPELIVSLTASMAGSSDLMLGNVIGSNLANIGLILTTAALLMRPTVDPRLWKFDIPLLLIATAIFSIFCYSGKEIVRWEGALMVLIFAGYTYRIISGAINNSEQSARPDNHNFWQDSLFIIAGGVGLFFGGEFVVESAIKIATNFGVSEAMIGLTIVAIGTSLPELSTTLVAAYKRESGIAIGNVIGSNLFNILAVAGPIAVISPVSVTSESARFLPGMILITVLLPIVIFKTNKLQRSRSVILLLAYVGAIVALIKGL
jgi:cation:H+ antiporter